MQTRVSTARFFLIAFAFTWGLQLPGVCARWGWLPGDPDAYLPFAMLGIFGPLVAATYLTARERGRAGVRALFGSLLAWRVSPKWYFVALFAPGILLSAILWALHHAGHPGPWYFLPSGPQLIIAFVVSVAEETGWRGYALPRLAPKYGAFGAAGIVGLLWAVWHIPMFLAVGISLSLAPVLILFFVGGSFLFTWVYCGSGGSLLLAVLAHVGAHLNNSHRALPGDALPLVVHAIVYALLGFVALRGSALESRRSSLARGVRSTSACRVAGAGPELGTWPSSRD
jgi:membrane protease YdiL (CAAX protease family)